MSTPVDLKSKPITRNSRKRTSEDQRKPLEELGASPTLQQTRKRKNSSKSTQGEPLSKKMAENQLLEAINGIRASVDAMEGQMRNAPSKEDMGSILNEIRGVRESVIRNTDRIDTLFDLRKEDLSLIHI